LILPLFTRQQLIDILSQPVDTVFQFGDTVLQRIDTVLEFLVFIPGKDGFGFHGYLLHMAWQGTAIAVIWPDLKINYLCDAKPVDFL
jgi:hypothetical protein